MLRRYNTQILLALVTTVLLSLLGCETVDDQGSVATPVATEVIDPAPSYSVVISVNPNKNEILAGDKLVLSIVTANNIAVDAVQWTADLVSGTGPAGQFSSPTGETVAYTAPSSPVQSQVNITASIKIGSEALQSSVSFQILPANPVQTVLQYYELLSSQQCDDAFEYFTTTFQNAQPNLETYCQFVRTVDRVTVENPGVVQNDGVEAVVTLGSVEYHMQNGTVRSFTDLQFFLRYDPTNNVWLINGFNQNN